MKSIGYCGICPLWLDILKGECLAKRAPCGRYNQSCFFGDADFSEIITKSLAEWLERLKQLSMQSGGEATKAYLFYLKNPETTPI